MGARSVTADGVSLEMLGGARVGVVYLTVWPQSFSGDLNVCEAVDECVALLIAREADLAKRKARNHNHDPTFDIFKQIVTLDLWKSPHYFKKITKTNRVSQVFHHTLREKILHLQVSECQVAHNTYYPSLWHWQWYWWQSLGLGWKDSSRTARFSASVWHLSPGLETSSVFHRSDPQSSLPIQAQIQALQRKVYLKHMISLTCWVTHIHCT